jgi:pyruvate dehydrogenase E1 component
MSLIPNRRARVEVLDEIAQRVLWLATRIVDSANHDRETGDGVKVGGHQASSASLVSAMTALYFSHLGPNDKVSVKPHASPTFHAIQYLLGNLDKSYLTTLRKFGGLQSYPSRTKDPDHPDFSTGSVGLGAAAPLFAAVTRRYVDAHFGARPTSRFIALIGDAELDEGNIWEAIADPATTGLGNVMWVVDFNRQSLDRIVPGIRIQQWRAQFQAAGWHVVEVKYGPKLQKAFVEPHGKDLENWIDQMANERYQALFGLAPEQVREFFLQDAPTEVREFCSNYSDAQLYELVTDLGGHDVEALLDAYEQCDAVTDRPSVVFAYTVKGWGLPLAGNPRNHSMLLTSEQIDVLRSRIPLTTETEWDRFEPASEAGLWAASRQNLLAKQVKAEPISIAVPNGTDLRVSKPISTQEAFGRILVDLSRDPQIAKHLVTTAPDVATSTNLAGFINKFGVFSPEERPQFAQDALVKWVESPSGHHIELGISEMNLFLLLGQLGLSQDLSNQRLIPIGTLYDPFVLRGLDAFVYSTYSAARFIVAGTPSGVTLAPEGGAHQSTITASVGLELPNVTLIEPTYATALDWLLCSAVSKIADPGKPDALGTLDDGSYYFRLTTRPIDQTPFELARTRIGDALLRRQVIAGAYRLHEGEAGPNSPVVQIAASGAVMPQVLAAAAELTSEGITTYVIDVTSLDRIYTAWQRTSIQGIRTATTPSIPGALRAAFDMDAPLVTVHDAASHSMAWLGGALGVPVVSLGVDSFGQSGSVNDLYDYFDLNSGSIVNAALASLAIQKNKSRTINSEN